MKINDEGRNQELHLHSYPPFFSEDLKAARTLREGRKKMKNAYFKVLVCKKITDVFALTKSGLGLMIA